MVKDSLYNKGVDAFWMDAAEPDIYSNLNIQQRKEMMYPNALGSADKYFNAYPLVNAKVIYEGQRAVNPSRRVFTLTRSAYAGSQRYAAAVWSGDIGARWHDMKNQISAGVNFSMSGLPYWTMDAGGFAVEHRYEHATGNDLKEWKELMTRWYQFSVFCPLFRVHGQFPFREIFNVSSAGEPAYETMLYYDKLRYRLLPYIYSISAKSYFDNYTIMRGLVMDFPHDKKVTGINDEYLFGNSFLINPVYKFNATNRQVYLPAGTGWYNLYDGKYRQGGRTISADAPFNRMPVFVKEGSIIPFGPAMQYAMQKKADTISLFVYTGTNAAFTLYEDDDTTYNYENGKFSSITFNYIENSKTLTIQNRKGNFPGILQNRIFNIYWIRKNKPVELNFDAKYDAQVLYNGKQLSVTMK
jgi:alpha-D-xyloside xylohydrolase